MGKKKTNKIVPTGSAAAAEAIIGPSTVKVCTEPKEGEIKISLRLQYLRNATAYLLNYKEKLQITSQVIR